MARICKICERPNARSYSFFPDVCDLCAGYDWGHWHIQVFNRAGFVLGGLVALLWALQTDMTVGYVYPGVLLFFVMVLGGLVGRAVTDALTNMVFNRLLIHTDPSAIPEDRAREAEKFFYISLLAAYQGKVRYAVRMLEQAKRHGWEHWERLTLDPQFRHFCRLEEVRRITD